MKKYYQTFQVKTTMGGFPIDMLRYDRCFPNDQLSAGIYGSKPPPGTFVTLGRYVGSKADLPTFDRWKSFGCEVIKESIEFTRLLN